MDFLRYGEGLHIVEREGNQKTGTRRRKGGKSLRDPATVEKEHRALTLLVKGHSQRAIALELDMSESGVSYLIRRALEMRAEALRPYVEQARTILIERYERLLERWWPMATGDWIDPSSPDGETPPSAQAVGVVLKIMEQLAKITGAERVAPVVPGAVVSTGDIHVHNHTVVEREALQGNVLAQLAKIREKQTYIDGELARVGTTQAQLTGQETDDMPGPPPRAGETAA